MNQNETSAQRKQMYYQTHRIIYGADVCLLICIRVEYSWPCFSSSSVLMLRGNVELKMMRHPAFSVIFQLEYAFSLPLTTDIKVTYTLAHLFEA